MALKHVVFYSKKLPPDNVGGIETNAFYFIRHLVACQNLKLSVITFTKKKIFYRKLKTIDLGGVKVDVHVFNKRITRHPNLFIKKLKFLGAFPDDSVIYHNSLDLHKIYKDLKSVGYKQVARSGGNDVFFMKSIGFGENSFGRDLNDLDLLFVNSEYSLFRMLSLGYERSLMSVLKGGCQRENDYPDTIGLSINEKSYSHPVILTCGRLVDFKGLEDALAALRIINEKGYDFTYLIVGDGPLKESLEKMVVEFGLAKKCVFLGKYSPDKIHRYYQMADIYLSTSKDILKNNGDRNYIHTETMGRSLCEAQSHGLPALVTDAGGAPEMIIDQETGFVVPQGDVDKIASALILLIEDKLLCKRFGDQAIKNVETNLSWGAVLSNTLQEMNNLFK